jgi:hypothetical protein
VRHGRRAAAPSLHLQLNIIQGAILPSAVQFTCKYILHQVNVFYSKEKREEAY